MSLDVAADSGFPCDTAAVLGAAVRGTLDITVYRIALLCDIHHVPEGLGVFPVN